VLFLIPIFPLAGFVLNASFGRRLSKSVCAAIACVAMAVSLGLSSAAVIMLTRLDPAARVVDQSLYTWMASGDFRVPLALRLDPLSALMILVVTGVGFLIHVYSVSYMHEETGSEYARYFSYMNLFAFFMLVLVLAANFPVMFVGWEGVGLCSYLLIGFWYRKKTAADAGKKAFIVNRVGDFGFLLGMFLLFATFGTLDFREVASAVAAWTPEAEFGTLSLAALLLFVGATGKSAQIPLYVWLPDAMEGPTPVSALIHAATMVTAGVYMIGRNAVLYSHAPLVLGIVAVVGLATSVLSATIGLVQNDIKRVLAYSTVSQLGLMFLGMGVGAYAAGIFHLFTHAFFKALLFLASGAVIHALAGEQDIRRMGGLRRDLPVTYWTFVIGALAISGIPGLAGFFSKDEILYRTFVGGHPWMWAIGVAASLMTGIYMFRLVFVAFHGERAAIEGVPALHSADGSAHPAGHGPAGERLHDAPRLMAIPLVLLAVGSVLAGYVGVPAILGGQNRIETFLEPSFTVHETAVPGASGEGAEPAGGTVAEAAGDGTTRTEITLMAVSSGIALLAIGVAFYFFLSRRQAAAALAARFAGIHRLLLHKYYVDEVYDAAIVGPIRNISTEVLWRGVDVGLVDGTVNGVGSTVRGAGREIRRLQTGSLRAYAAGVLGGALLILGYYLWR
jgi:NADH-quinone oxidoreductase subunit L